MLHPVLVADAAVQAWFTSWPRTLPLDIVMLIASGIGWRGGVWLVLALVAGWRWRGQAAMAAWRVVLAIALATLVTDVALKPFFGRDRPFVVEPAARVIGPRSAGKAFPSGHAASAVAGAYAVSLLWPTRRRVWWALAALICLSRLYLGVHYPIDVAGGALVGWACAFFATAGVGWSPRETPPQPA
jgi:undecaprenyl-diphosphatase